jgi:predicted nicotinamide N-methyase
MPGYTTRDVAVRVAGCDYLIRALSDLHQYHDPEGEAARAGISSASWGLFGQLWPAGIVLAEALGALDLRGKRILEIGCGLGLSSLVMQRRGGDVTASDHHPLAESFLRHNAALNGLSAPRYVDLPWDANRPALGDFDLIVGADVLYERAHAALVLGVMERHGHDAGEVILADPGRGNSSAFATGMRGLGYELTERRCAFAEGEAPPHRGRLLSWRRAA